MRLIDADDIAYESIDSSDTNRHEYYYGTGIVAIRKEDIDDAPTIDAVEVVRCKDCKHRQEDTIFHKLYCDGREVVADGYCWKGERRSDE